nr:lipopolysaccharide biosynthesis protein [uncultured Sphaerochaeta sp.]
MTGPNLIKPHSEIIANLFWKFFERFGTQGLQFIIQVILARLLFPSDYGVLALVVIFITIANVFVQSGLSTSLIQKKVVDQVDYSSVLYISLGIAGILYCTLYFMAPLIGVFYDNDGLVLVLRVLALTLFPGAFNSIQNAIVSRMMQFKRLFYSSVGAGIVSGIVGISLAYYGYGIWALVFQQLTNQICITLILWFTVKWRPTLQFSFERVKVLFSFGWKLLVSSLIDTIYNDLRSLLIGKIYTPATLGYYNRGQQFPQLLISNINGSIQSVMLPALAAQQDYTERVKSMMRRSIVTSSFIVFPLMVGLAVVAKPLVLLLLTEKWLPSVPFLQIFCFSYALWPIHTANLQAINAMGRSDIFLKLEIVKKIFGLVILAVSLPFGVYYLALGQVVSGIISSFINAYPNKKLLNYGYGEQMKDIFPSLILSLIMGVFVYLLLYLGLSPLITMLIQIFVGVVIYAGLAFIFKLECFTYLVQTVLSLFKTKRDTKTK